MKKLFITTILIMSIIPFLCAQNGKKGSQVEETIFVFGGDVNPKFISYVINLTNKPNPKICYLPTASADNEDNIKYWNFICNKLSIEPHVLKVWVSSAHSDKTFEEILLDMDAIVVGGGNTLNMMGIWKYQEIDKILVKALRKGTVLAGGSAGSICWFQNGVSDARPVHLSIVDGLGILPYSNCPHYSDALKKDMYHQQIKDGKMKNGYASDDLSGIVFKNGVFSKAVSLSDMHNSYYVSKDRGEVKKELLQSEIIVNKDAIPATSYVTENVGKKIKDFAQIFNQDTPLDAFISLKYLTINGDNSKNKEIVCYANKDKVSDSDVNTIVGEDKKDRLLNTDIYKIFVYNDSVAAILNKGYNDFYSLWYFFREDGKWLSAGEDIGGDSIFDSEISFREKAKMNAERVHRK